MDIYQSIFIEMAIDSVIRKGTNEVANNDTIHAITLGDTRYAWEQDTNTFFQNIVLSNYFIFHKRYVPGCHALQPNSFLNENADFIAERILMVIDGMTVITLGNENGNTYVEIVYGHFQSTRCFKNSVAL